MTTRVTGKYQTVNDSHTLERKGRANSSDKKGNTPSRRFKESAQKVRRDPLPLEPLPQDRPKETVQKGDIVQITNSSYKDRELLEK